jgi:NADPH:quinone reductase-like Zn-dependent oxidoreductase
MESHKNHAVKYLNGKFSFIEEDLPKPGQGQILIKNAYSTVNPYDRIMFNVNKDENFVLGCDGCGTVIETGEGLS